MHKQKLYLEGLRKFFILLERSIGEQILLFVCIFFPLSCFKVIMLRYSKAFPDYF